MRAKPNFQIIQNLFNDTEMKFQLQFINLYIEIHFVSIEMEINIYPSAGAQHHISNAIPNALCANRPFACST